MTRRRPSRSLIALCALLPCCAERESAPTSPVAQPQTHERTDTDRTWPPFAVRGRLREPLALRYRIEDADGPLPRSEFRAAIVRAIDAWNATGCVRMTEADAKSTAVVAFGWRRGHHGACEPFGPTGAVAHAGPVDERSHVHFDAARTWTADGDSASSVFAVALHELGHVFGLGHVEAARSVMHSGTLRPTMIGAEDLAGLRSLYGGGDDGDASDLRIRKVADGALLTTLRSVAPQGRTDLAGLDVDGDGQDELLVWRTDAAGHGALMVYGFGPGPRLERTAGPFIGAVVPGSRTAPVVTDHGERLLVSELPNGRRNAQSFSDLGELEPFGGEPPPLPAQRNTEADFDGDGTRERFERADR